MMLDAITRSALARPLLTVLAALLLVAGGIYAVMKLPIDAFPDVSAPQVKIIVKLPGMTPEEMEARVTTPVEIEMLGLPKQTMLRSTSKYGLTDITIDFEDGTDIYWARNQVAERLTGIMGDLPPGLSGGLAPITTPLGEMFMFTVEGDASLAERRALLDWVIRPALRTVSGVADVNVLGGEAAAYEVVPDAARMAAVGVTLEQLRSTLERFNRNDGAGRINEGEETLLVRVQGRLESLDDIRRLVVQSTPQAQVRIGDVADVRLGALTRMGGVTHNGIGETVQGLVLGLRGADAQALVRGVRARLDELATSLPEGVKIVPFYDRGELVSSAVGTVSKALMEAVVLVLVLLFLFLGNLRAAVAVAVVLPLAALGTFLMMHFAGLSANLMSLGGLAIAIGLLVDAAVVVVENVVAHMHSPDAGHRSREQVVLEAVREVSVPTTAGILIIALVFVPLLSLQGLEGKLFAPVALTIVFALAASLLLSLTIIPLLAKMMLDAHSHSNPWLPRVLSQLYAPLLKRSLASPGIVGGIALLLGAGAVVVYMGLGKTFMPTMNEGSLIVQLEKLPSISLDASLDIDTRFQQALKERVPEALQIVARAGADEIGLDPMGLNQTDTFISLKPGADKPDILRRIRELLGEFPGVAYAFTQPIEMRVSEMILGVRGDLAVRLFGPDIGVLNDKAGEIADVLRGIQGAEDVFFTRNEGVQYLRVVPDVEALARAGLDVDALSALLRAQIEGERVGLIQKLERRIPLVVRADGSAQAAGDLARMPVGLPDGGRIALGQLATFERVDGPVQINRQLGSRNMVVVANVGGRDLVGFVEEARAQVLQKVELPTGYRLTWGGEFENQQRAAKRLAMVVPATLVLIFLILFSTFNSLRQAALVMANVPFAMIGGVFALGLSGEYLSVPASVGFIALLGIAVLNGVVLVSCFNQLRASGLNMHDTVLAGAQRRLRPVLLTASMAALGLVPLLFATGPGSEIQRPLAIVVIGGLLTCTALTLVLLPILYKRFGEAPAATPPMTHA
jgi:heavy metal efflux system protein